MAIKLKYGAPGAILQSGFAAGVGHRQQAQQKDLLDIWQQQTQQDFQANQAALARQQQLGLQRNAQNFDLGVEARRNKFNLDFREQQNKFNAEQDRLNRNAQAVEAQAARFARAGEGELDREQQLLLQKNAMEARRAQDTEEGIRTGALELPGPAQQKLDKLEADHVAAMTDPTLTDAARQEFIGKYEKQKQALYGTARAKPRLSPQEEFQQNTFTKDGTTYQRNSKGGFDVLKEPPDNSKQMEKFQADTAKYWKDVQAEAQRLQKGGAGEDGTMKPLDTYVEEAKKNLSMFKITEPQPPAAPQQTSGQAAMGGGMQLPPQQQDGEHFVSTGITQGLEQQGAPPPAPQEIAPGFPDQPQFGPGFGQNIKGMFAPQAGAPQSGMKVGVFQGNPAAAAQTQDALRNMTAQQQLESVKAQGYTEQQALAYLDKIKGMSGNQSQYTPEMRKSILQGSQLPKPQSEEELKAHPEWPSFVAPDGTIRKNPYAR